MKTRKVGLFIFLILCIPSVKGCESEDTLDKVANRIDDSASCDISFKNLRRMPPKFSELGYKPSKEGIRTGYIFFLGHYIPPPYKFSNDKATGACYLNGINIFPGGKYTKEKQSQPSKDEPDIFEEVHWREVVTIVNEAMEVELRKRGIRPYEKNDNVNMKYVIDAAKATIQETKEIIGKYAELSIYDDALFLVKWRTSRPVSAAGIDFNHFLKPKKSLANKKNYKKSDEEISLLRNQFGCNEILDNWILDLRESEGIIVNSPGSIGQAISENDAKEILSIINNNKNTICKTKLELEKIRKTDVNITEEMVLMFLAVKWKVQ